MGVDRCILEKARAGRVSLSKVERLLDDLKKQQSFGFNEDRAAVEVLELAKRRAQQKKRNRLLLAAKQIEIGRRIDAADPDHKAAAAKSFLHFDESGRFGGDNVATRHETVRGLLHAKMADAIERFRSRAAGIKKAGSDQVGMRKLLRELMGESTRDAEAKSIAAGVAEAQELARLRFNDAGGDIQKRQDFGVPHIHNREALARVTQQEWVEYVLPKLDRSRMLNADGKPMTDAEIRQTLSGAYEEIVTGGMSDTLPEENGFSYRKAIANTRQERRFLSFANADAWLDYQERFGTGNLFEAIMNHIDGMARDIALMEVLGPNADATVRFMKRKVEEGRRAAAVSATGKAASRLLDQTGIGTIDALYDQVSGQALIPASEKWANRIGTVRALEVFSKLGSAFLSSVSDVAFTGLTAGFNGFSGTRVIGRLVRTFATVSKAERVNALRAGFAVDTWTSTLAAQQRFAAEAVGHEWAKRVSDVVLRSSFLSAWTEAGKVAFTQEFMFHLVDQVGRGFNDLPGHLQRAFRRHGVSPEDWDRVRAAPLARNGDGLDVIDIPGIYARGDATLRGSALRLQGMILNEQKFAVPEATAKTRALLTGETRGGSLMGEVVRSAALFKTFPVTILQTHVFGRLLRDTQISVRNRIGYGAKLFIGTTVMGALALQLKDISRGRDPRPMTTAEFWTAAAMQGGGLGILGDFLFADHNRYGGSLTASLAGPVAGTLEQAVKLTAGNLQELRDEGEAKNLGPEVVNFVKNLLPGQNLWYTRLAFERTVLDNLMRAADPDYAQRFRRIERRAQRDYGQGFFAPPGGGLERGPDLSNALRSS